MKQLFFLFLFVGYLVYTVDAQTQSTNDPLQVKVFVQGDSSRLPDFIESLKREFSEQRMKLELVQRGDSYDYNIIIAQETSMGGAAAAVIALDKNCNFVASVVRSGRFSGKGSLNASAKEMAKKIAVFRGAK